MKELLTLKEAASLTGWTTKTIKNYIKQGRIKNFFLVEGKYGQEYRISIKDVEALRKKTRGSSRGKKGSVQGKNRQQTDFDGLPGQQAAREDIYDRPEYQFLLRRNDEILMQLGRCREKVESLEEVTLKLKQEIHEKDMLIDMLMSKKSSG